MYSFHCTNSLWPCFADLPLVCDGNRSQKAERGFQIRPGASASLSFTCWAGRAEVLSSKAPFELLLRHSLVVLLANFARFERVLKPL